LEGFPEYSNEPSGFINGREVLDYLQNKYVLKKKANNEMCAIKVAVFHCQMCIFKFSK